MSNFPSRCVRTSEELGVSSQRRQVGRRSQRGPRRGDRNVGRAHPPCLVSADAGENWNTVPLDPAEGNGTKLFVLSDDRLMIVQSGSTSAPSACSSQAHPRTGHNWRNSVPFQVLGVDRRMVDAYQHGLVVNYVRVRRGVDVEPSGVQHRSHRLVDHPRTRLLRQGSLTSWTRRSCTRPNRDRRSAHQAEHGDPSEASRCGHRRTRHHRHRPRLQTR